MPYRDATKQRQSVREAVRRHRARKAGKAVPLRVLPVPVDPVLLQPARDEPVDLIDWLQTLPVTQGEGAGRPLEILPWQRDVVADLQRDDIQSMALSVGRANGKSTLLASIAAASIAGPLVQPRADTVVVAASFMQSRIIFEHTLAFLSDRIAEDRKRWRILDSSNVAWIQDRETGARLRCLGCDPARAHGLAPALVLADEGSQWPAHLSERMRAALATAAGKLPVSRFVALGTRPADSAHWFQSMLDGGADAVHCYAAGRDDDVLDADVWRRANPSMDYWPALRRAIEREARQAAVDTQVAASFRALRLNSGTADTVESLLLDAGVWAERVEVDALPPASGPMAWGVDLGGSSSMSALSAYWPQSGRLECLAAFSGIPSLEQRGRRDSVGDLYGRMARDGELLVQHGQHTVQVGDLLRAGVERWGRPAVLGADRYRASDLQQAMSECGLSCGVLLRGQGYRDGAEDVRRFRRACLDGRVSARRSLLMRWALSEARTISDPAGNAKLAKKSEAGRRQAARDDAVAAMLISISCGEQVPAAKPWTWHL